MDNTAAHAVRYRTAREYIRTQIADASFGGSSREDAIAAVHVGLEKLAITDPVTACSLMAVLWPAASKLCLHDICDATDLYILDCMNTELTAFIHWLIETELDSDTKEYFIKWTEPPYVRGSA